MGAFSTTFKVGTFTAGDGVCVVPGHLTRVSGVGEVGGRGTVLKITFESPYSGGVQPLQVVVSDDPAQSHTHSLFQEVGNSGPSRDR